MASEQFTQSTFYWHSLKQTYTKSSKFNNTRMPKTELHDRMIQAQKSPVTKFSSLWLKTSQ